jgi:hypothetical protein
LKILATVALPPGSGAIPPCAARGTAGTGRPGSPEGPIAASSRRRSSSARPGRQPAPRRTGAGSSRPREPRAGQPGADGCTLASGHVVKLTASGGGHGSLRPTTPGPAAWPPPSSSAPPPGCCPPSAPHVCPPLRRSGASDKTGNRQDRQRVPWRGFRRGTHGHLHPRDGCLVAYQPFSSRRAITMRWIWLVPSQIWVVHELRAICAGRRGSS